MSSPLEDAIERAEARKQELATRAPRLKPLEEWTVDDHVRAGRGGEEIVNPAYEAAKRHALAKAGFDEESQEKDPADMSVEDHMADIARCRR